MKYVTARTKKITTYGRLFFLLTALTMIGGFYAQWLDNTDEAKRNKEAQANIVRLINNTDNAVAEISRVLRPIESMTISASFEIDCNSKEFKPFCLGNLQKLLSTSGGYKYEAVGLGYEEADWSAWPTNSFTKQVSLPSLDIFFVRDFTDAETDSSKGYTVGVEISPKWDMKFSARVPKQGLGLNTGNHQLLYSLHTKRMGMLDIWRDVKPSLATNKILSVVDLLGITLIVRDSLSLYPAVKLAYLSIVTSRGNSIDTGKFEVVKVPYGIAYVYHFPAITNDKGPD